MWTAKPPAHAGTDFRYVTRALRVAALTGALTGALLSAPAAWAAEIGQPAPLLNLPGASGTVTLPARGKVVLVDFWASWCGPCRQSFPWMNRMQQRHGAKGLQIVAVNVDQDRAEAEAFLRKLPAGFTVAFDSSGDTPRRWGVRAMPTSVLIGADGRVIAQHAGFRPADEAELEARIVEALAAAR